MLTIKETLEQARAVALERIDAIDLLLKELALERKGLQELLQLAPRKPRKPRSDKGRPRKVAP